MLHFEGQQTTGQQFAVAILQSMRFIDDTDPIVDFSQHFTVRYDHFESSDESVEFVDWRPTLLPTSSIAHCAVGGLLVVELVVLKDLS